MKKLFLFLVLFCSMGAFAQIEHYPMPPLQLYEWRMFTYYTCDSNGNEITNPNDYRYKKYEVMVSVPVNLPPKPRITDFVHDRLRDQICQYGRITDRYTDYFYVVSITRSSIFTTPLDKDLIKDPDLIVDRF